MEASIKGKMIKLVILLFTVSIAIFLTYRIVETIKIVKLNDAIENEDREAISRQIRQLSKKEIDSAGTKRAYNPLILACEKGDIETVQLLIDKGVDINVRDQSTGNTPLLSALYNRNSLNRCKIAELLIKYGADVNAQNIFEETALTRLIYQSQNTRDESIELFKILYNKSDVDAMFPNSYMRADTALEMVAAEDMPELVDWLIEKGDYSHSDIPSDDSGSYLHNYYKKTSHEYIYRCPNMIKYIVDSGLEDIDSPDSEGRTIISIAAEMNQIEDCKLFIKLGADPTIEDKTGKNASDYATAKNNIEILKLLERY